jgi:hypothetical protein
VALLEIEKGRATDSNTSKKAAAIAPFFFASMLESEGEMGTGISFLQINPREFCG